MPDMDDMDRMKDKAMHKAEELKGSMKEKLGAGMEDEDMREEGMMDQAKAKAKQVGDDVREAVSNIKDKLT